MPELVTRVTPAEPATATAGTWLIDTPGSCPASMAVWSASRMSGVSGASITTVPASEPDNAAS